MLANTPGAGVRVARWRSRHWIMTCAPRKNGCLAAFWSRSPAERSCFSVPRTKTSDFMVDGVFLWWEERNQALSGVKQLIINLDNGPECNGRRRQFLLRMTEFADMTGLCVRLVYYPPYHSKYNGIERYWAGLEKSWNGYLLNTVDTVLKRARNFFWKGMRIVVRLLDAPYEKGVKVCGNEKIELEQRLQRSTVLQWWDITIHPKVVLL